MKYRFTYSNELWHWGIKGQKWGRRRFRNEDGTLTPAGKKRYGSDPSKYGVENVREQFLINQSGYLKNEKNKKIMARLNDEIIGSKEYKKYLDLTDQLTKKIEQIENNDKNEIDLGDDFVDRYDNARDAAAKRGKQIFESHYNDLASVALTEMGYEDTKAGRDFMIKYILPEHTEHAFDKL